MAYRRSMASRCVDGLNDGLHAIKLATSSSAGKLLQSWFYVPLGIMVMLVACFGVDVLLKKVSFAFPASVACLIMLFFGLLLSEFVLGGHRTRKMVALIDISAGWSLRWINVLFTPSFVLLPLSPAIGIVEVSKIIAVFIIGFLVMMAMAAYLTRGLQLALGSSKRAVTERAEEMGDESDRIPIAETPRSEYLPESRTISASASSIALDTLATAPPMPSAAQIHSRNDGILAVEADAISIQASLPAQEPLPLPRAQIWAVVISGHLDWGIYLFIFILVGLPVYYVTGYAMPAQLSFSILTYFAAMSIPPQWRQYIHPVLVSSLLTVLGIWALAAIRGDDLHTGLNAYRTGAKYLQLWESTKSHGMPGAGDVFGTVLDASIVSLALPMYQYRRELRDHFFAIVIPNVVLSIASLFSYPKICFAIGISAQRSLAFAARSLTLALATPAAENLGGDLNTVAALAIMSGILGVLIGQRMLAWMKIPEDDYVTRGVTLGANSSAIATALLLRTDPRAAALSSLSMSLFGTITVLFTSIPPIANLVRSLVE